MPPLSSRPTPILVLLLLLAVVPAAAQEADTLPGAPRDTLAPADTLVPVDTLAPADTLAALPADSVPADTLRTPLGDPRLTWLGDTLAPADSALPKFTQLREVFADSLVDPYTIHRPAAWLAWEIQGDALMGRGAYRLLDVLQSEAPIVASDVGGSGLPAFLGSPMGTWTNVQVVVDGVPVGNPLEAAWDLRRIPMEGIARVAWYPGAQVAAWGGEGTGGVLEITTRRNLADGARSQIGFHIGRTDAQGFAGALGRPIGDRGQAFVAANFDDIEGLERRGDYTRNQLVAKASVRLFDDHVLEAARWSDGLSGDVNRADISGEEDSDAATLHLFYRGRVGPLAASAAWWRESHDIAQSFNFATRPVAPNLVPGIFGEAERRGWKGRLRFEAGPLLAWAEALRNEDEVTSSHPAFTRLDGTSIFEPPGEDAPEDPALLPSPRVRTEYAGGAGWGRPSDRFAANLAVRRTDYGDAAGSGVSWQAEALGRPGGGVVLRGSAGRAVRAADLAGQALLEGLASEALEIHPNRLADPRELETWTSWRAEVAWMKPGWRLAGGVFGATGSDAFLWVPPSAWLHFDRTAVDDFVIGDLPYNTFDVLDVSMTGFEAELRAPLPFGVDGLLKYRRLDAKREELGEDPLPNLPENQALGQLRYARRYFPSRDLLFEGRFVGRYVGERPAVLEDEGSLPAYLVADLLAQATVINFTVYVSFKNLFATAYRAEDSFFLPDQQWFLGILWRFRN